MAFTGLYVARCVAPAPGPLKVVGTAVDAACFCVSGLDKCGELAPNDAKRDDGEKDGVEL